MNVNGSGNNYVNGNVGVGTSTPSNKLTVIGNADVTGNVGVGTSAPVFKLDVNGSIGPWINNAYDLGSTTRYFQNGYITNLYTGTSGVVGYWNRFNSTLSPTTNTDTIGTLGNLGIGTTSPLNKLDVSGSVAFGSLPTQALPTANSLYVSGAVGIGITNPGAAGSLLVGSRNYTMAAGDIAGNGGLSIGNVGVNPLSNSILDIVDSRSYSASFVGERILFNVTPTTSNLTSKC